MSNKPEIPISVQNDSEKESIKFFAANINILSNAADKDNRFRIFDFTPTAKIYKVDIGENIIPELEYDLFNGIEVNRNIPFVVLNSNSNKTKEESDNRKFKLYHPDERNFTHKKYLSEWKSETNIQDTMILKVLTDDTNIDRTSYINIVYKFNEGLFIEFEKDTSQGKMDEVVEILSRQIHNFNIKKDILSSIKGSFVVDGMAVDKFLFRHILMTKHHLSKDIPNLYPLKYLWINEKIKSLSMRSQIKMKFEMAGVKCNISISKKTAASNDTFYMSGAPVRFKPETEYDLISISELNSLDTGHTIRKIIGSLYYLYAFTVENSNTPSLSMNLANIYNYMIGKNLLQGSIFGPTKIISIEDVKSIDSRIAQLKMVDPDFWGKAAAGRTASGEKQPVVIVRTIDSNWQDRLRTTLYNIRNSPDPEINRIQIVRYPFEVVDDLNIPSSINPITKVSPYFIMGQYGRPYLNLVVNKNPKGGNGTIHPYIPVFVKKPKITTPGYGTQSEIEHLINMDEPYVIQMNRTKESTVGTNLHTKTGILKPDADGEIPPKLISIFNRLYSNIPNKRYVKHGILREPESILDICIKYGQREDIKITYSNLITEDKKLYLKQDIKKLIDDEMKINGGWNAGRQELYDIDSEKIRSLFMKNDTFIDPYLFKSILEKFFNVFLLIINFDGKNSQIEVPRHKYLYINSNKFPTNPTPLIILKHDGILTKRGFIPQCEPIRIKSGNDFINWNINKTKMLFNKANYTLDVGFSNLKSNTIESTGINVDVKAEIKPNLFEIFNSSNILNQYIDGAGKTRAISYRYSESENGEVIILCEPCQPLSKKSTLSISRFKEHSLYTGISLIETFGLSKSDIQYKINNDMIVGIWFKLQKIQFFIQIEPSLIKHESDRSVKVNNTSYVDLNIEDPVFKLHDYFERVMNIMIQLLRNLYIYSKLDDPKLFIDTITIIDPGVIYDISNSRRVIGSARKFKSDLRNYYKLYPSFFSTINLETGEDTNFPKLIVDSEETKDGLFQHLVQVQTLKLDIVGASGWKYEYQKLQNGTNVVVYTPLINDNYDEEKRSVGITPNMIESIDRLGDFFMRPGYIEHFYENVSDFSVWNPGSEQILMSEEEFVQYFDFIQMEKENSLLTVPLPSDIHLTKSPQYFMSQSGNLYLIQNTSGWVIEKSINIILNWISSRTNLGYYALKYNPDLLSDEDVKIITELKSNILSVKDIDSIMGSNKYDEQLTASYVLIKYDSNKYGAMMKMSGFVSITR